MDRYEQIILEYTQTKEEEVLMIQKRDDATLTSSGKSQVPISQLNIEAVTCILLIYSHFGKEIPFIDSLIDHTMLYEFDILVNEAENSQNRKTGGHKQYFCEAFCGALIVFFEKKMTVLNRIFVSKEDHTSEKVKRMQSNTYEKFLFKVVMSHKEHLKVEFCDQVAIEM